MGLLKSGRFFEIGLGILLICALSSARAFAFGPTRVSSDEIGNKSEYLASVLREFNEKYSKVEVFYENEKYWDRSDHSDSRLLQLAQPSLERAKVDLCQRIGPMLDMGITCESLVKVETRVWKTEDSYRLPGVGGVICIALTVGLCSADNNIYNRYFKTFGYAQFTAVLTEKGQALSSSVFFHDPNNAAVDYNVRIIQAALMSLQLLPSQRKTIDGFWNAAATFTSAIESEKEKSESGERALPLTHRIFQQQASLLVAYHRYLKDDLVELAQFGSSVSGPSRVNRESIEAIAQSIEHLSLAYGLEQGTGSKQVADYGRVLVDLLNNFAQPLTLHEKSVYIQPIMAVLAAQVIPASEAYGDAGAQEAVMKLKGLWEKTEFEAFLEEKLSASDEKITNLILNLGALTYRLGLSANVEIRTFDSKDLTRIRSRKVR